MPRLFPAEAPKRRLYKALMVTTGLVLTCYGLLMAASMMLPILRERIGADRAGSVIAFRDRIVVHSKPTAITMSTRSSCSATPSARPCRTDD
jgi:transcriptional regulator GlxA family with amidase domain